SVFDENGKFRSYRFVYINKAYEEITGVKHEDVKGKTVHEVWPGTEDSWIEAYGKVAMTGEASSFEMYHEPTKKQYFCQVYRPYPTNKRFCVVFEDITKRVEAGKARETAENRYKQLFDRSLDGVVACDLEGRIVDCNRAYREMLGYSLEELRGMDFRQITPQRWRKEEERIVAERIKKRGYSGLYQKEYIKKDGSVISVELSSYLIKDPEGRPEGMWGIARDITERKKREKELSRSERFNRLTLSSIPDSVFLTDTRGHFKFVCSSPDIIFGKSARDIEEQHTIHNLLGGEPLPLSDLSPDELRTEERKITDARGEEKYVSITMRGVRFMDSSALIVCRDDTGSIKARQALARREADMAGVFRAVPAGVGVVNNRVISWGNELLSRITGYSREELAGLEVRNLYPSDKEYSRVGKEFYSMLEDSGQAELEIDIRRKDGRDVRALLRGAQVRGDNPKADVVFAMLDITAARKSREKLRVTRYCVEKAGLEIYWIRPGGGFYDANEKACDSLGYSREELLSMYVWDMDPLYPEADREETWRSIRKAGYRRFESVHRTSGGREYPVEVTSHYVEYEGNELEIAFAQDISERKKFMADLEVSRRRYKELFDSMSNAVAVYEAVAGGEDFIFKDLNDAGQRLEKVEKADVVGKRVTECFPGVEDFGLLDVMRSVYNSGAARSLPVRFYRDERIAGWRRNYVYKLPTGEIVCVYEDITEQKRIEREKNDLFELSIDMFCVAGFDGYFKQLNPAWEKTLGWDRKQLMKVRWAEFIHPDDIHRTSEVLKRLEQGKRLTGFENRFRHADGSYRWFSWNSYPVPERGVILAVARDVTDARLRREELKRAKAKLQASIEASPAAIIISTAPDGKLEMANKAALRLSAG
ncbi:MAG: PAS domain S-box protein, partial [Candidatus Omnitrophica bacterium]|nr:PAS domain S-box protein [Candidatus Omnitrophota bacterium]